MTLAAWMFWLLMTEISFAVGFTWDWEVLVSS
jgi:hypothetical protein